VWNRTIIAARGTAILATMASAPAFSRRSHFATRLPMPPSDQTPAVGPIPTESRTSAIRPGSTEGRPRVLVAEDNPINQQVVCAQLKLIGADTVVAVDGEVALARWREGGFTLLLTDLQMPRMDGYQLARSIRGEERAPTRIPIIALTANSLQDESLRCRAAGMDDYLTKPVRLVALQAAVERWTDRRGPSLSQAPTTQPPGSRPRPSAREAVEVGVLAGLVGDDPAGLAALLGDFAVSAAQSAVDLSVAAGRGDHGAAGFVAHRLKGAARTVGAIRLGNLCAHVESAAARSDGVALVASLALLQLEVVAVREWIAAASSAKVAAEATDHLR
jgi:CheY-like chemotaxis protein/HPt (histidine-containing phosphotransfer) domain-containing protein